MFTIRHGCQVKGRLQVGDNKNNYHKASGNNEGIEIYTNGVLAAGWQNGQSITDTDQNSIVRIEAIAENSPVIALLNGIDDADVAANGLFIDVNYDDPDPRLFLATGDTESSVYYQQTYQEYDDPINDSQRVDSFKNVGWIFKKNTFNQGYVDALGKPLYNGQVFMSFVFDDEFLGNNRLLSCLTTISGGVTLAHAHYTVDGETGGTINDQEFLSVNVENTIAALFGSITGDFMPRLISLNVDTNSPQNEKYQIDDADGGALTSANAFLGFDAYDFANVEVDVSEPEKTIVTNLFRQCTTSIQTVDANGNPFIKQVISHERLIPIIMLALRSVIRSM